MNEKRDRLEAALSIVALVALALVCAWAAVEGQALLGFIVFSVGCYFVAVRGGLKQ